MEPRERLEWLSKAGAYTPPPLRRDASGMGAVVWALGLLYAAALLAGFLL